MIESVKDIVAVLGSVIIATGGAVAIFKRPRPMNTAVSTERFLKVENKLDAFEKEACRIKDEMIETRRRHDSVVDGIYSEISKLRELIIETIKQK